MPDSQSSPRVPCLSRRESGLCDQCPEGGDVAGERKAGGKAPKKARSQGEKSMTEDGPIKPTPTMKEQKSRDNDGLHKRRGIWHYKLKIGAKWKELSAKTTNYQEARKARQKALQDQEQGRLPNDLAKLRFEKAAELWLIDREKFVAPKTHRIDRERLVPLKAE